MFFSKLKSFFAPPTTDELLKNSDIYIDKFYFDKCLKGKYLLKLKFRKVKVGLLKGLIGKETHDLRENKLYKYLQNRQNLVEKDEAFEGLIANIEKNGYNPKSIIICKSNSNAIKDGQHRAVYLMWKHGPDYEVNIVHIHVKRNLLRYKLMPWLKLEA